MFTIHILIVWTLKHFSFRVMISRSKNNIIITELFGQLNHNQNALVCISFTVSKIFILDHQYAN